MKYTRTNDSPTKVTLTLTLDSDDLAGIKQSTLDRLAKKMKVPGFRPGRVPLGVAEKHLDANALNTEVAEDAVNRFVLRALREESLQPLDQPHVDLTKYVPNEVLECAVHIEVLGPVALADYKNLTASKQSVKVTDKDIDDVVERMRQGLAEKKTVSRVSRTGDEVLIDFEGKDEKGEPVAGASGKDFPLKLGSDSFIPGFEAGLTGKKAGETVTLPLTFPKDYHHKPLAGAKVTFTVTIKEVREIALPALDDVFAAKCGPFKTIAELRADIKRELTDQKEREALDAFKNDLIEQLVKGSEVPAPDVLIADQMKSLERDFTQNLLYRGQTLDEYLSANNLTQETWRAKELRDQAIRRVKIGLVLAELSKLEKIDVASAEIEKRLRELLEQYSGDAQIRKQLDTPEVRRDVANQLQTEKTLDRLVELNAPGIKK